MLTGIQAHKTGSAEAATRAATQRLRNATVELTVAKAALADTTERAANTTTDVLAQWHDYIQPKIEEFGQSLLVSHSAAALSPVSAYGAKASLTEIQFAFGKLYGGAITNQQPIPPDLDKKCLALLTILHELMEQPDLNRNAGI